MISLQHINPFPHHDLPFQNCLVLAADNDPSFHNKLQLTLQRRHPFTISSFMATPQIKTTFSIILSNELQ